MLFTVELDILLAKKVALHIFFLIITGKSTLILMILHLQKKHCVMLYSSLSQFLIKIKIIIAIYF